MATGWVRLATFDVDGTLTLVHGWQVIATALGRRPLYDDAIARFRAGGVSEDEHITRLLNLATGHTVAEVQSAVAATPKLAHIAEGVRRLHTEGVRTALLTHNPDYVTNWYRESFGFDDAGGLVGAQPAGPPLGTAVGLRADKRTGLAGILARQGADAASTVHVGDALPDAQIFPLVGGGIALNPKGLAVERAADQVLRSTDFLDVADAVLSLPVRK